MIRLLESPGGQLASHIVLAVTLVVFAAYLWQNMARTEDTREILGEVDEDVESLLTRVTIAEDRLDGIVHWLWAFIGESAPEPVTEELPALDDEDEPSDTVISHPAATRARMAALLDKYAHHGSHRPDAGGRTVDEIRAEAGLPQRAVESS